MEYHKVVHINSGRIIIFFAIVTFATCEHFVTYQIEAMALRKEVIFCTFIMKMLRASIPNHFATTVKAFVLLV